MRGMVERAEVNRHQILHLPSQRVMQVERFLSFGKIMKARIPQKEKLTKERMTMTWGFWRISSRTSIRDEEDEDEHEDEDGILLNRDGTIQTGGMEKQTQTQTQIQMQQEIDDFFDSNYEGFSYYRTALEASINEDQNNNDVDSGGNRNNFISMRVHLYLRKALMHLRLDDGPAAHSCRECLATAMEHLDLSLTDNGSHQNVSMTMSAFGIDCVTSYGDDDDGSHVPFSLLHFLDTSARSDGVYHDAIPVHSVFSMNIDTVQNGKDSPEVNILVSVSPMQLVYRDSTISKVMKGMERISRSDNEDHAVVSAEDDVSTDNSGSNLSCHLTCERLLILVPILTLEPQ